MRACSLFAFLSLVLVLGQAVAGEQAIEVYHANIQRALNERQSAAGGPQIQLNFFAPVEGKRGYYQIYLEDKGLMLSVQTRTAISNCLAKQMQEVAQVYLADGMARPEKLQVELDLSSFEVLNYFQNYLQENPHKDPNSAKIAGIGWLEGRTRALLSYGSGDQKLKIYTEEGSARVKAFVTDLGAGDPTQVRLEMVNAKTDGSKCIVSPANRILELSGRIKDYASRR